MRNIMMSFTGLGTLEENIMCHVMFLSEKLFIFFFLSMFVNKVNLSHSETQIYVTFNIVKFINILTFSFQ